MQTMVTAKDIHPGDRVQLETGEWVTVTHTGKGMYPGSTLVEWKGKPGEDWGHVFPGQQVPIQTRGAG
jgi:hypothetical protein